MSAQNWALFFLSPNFEDVEQIDIKDISGAILLTTLPNEGCKRKFTLMKEDYITLKFSLESPIFFKLGSYVECDFGLFEVCDLQKPVFNTDNAGYDYELQLDAHYWKWKNKIFKYTPEVAGQEASWNLTASLDVQAGIVLRNLKALGYAYKGQDFVFSIDGTVENKAQLMSYDNVNILDACFSMAKKWDCECWITENIIHFGRCEFGDAVNFEIGKNVDKMSRSDSQSTYATRIYAFGSTRNIPANYRPVDESVVVNGVVQRRLMLPSGIPYIDAYPNMTTEEAVEQVVVFDSIYPRRTGTITAVSSYEDTVDNEDGTETTETFYRFTDTGINFSYDYVLEGEELHVVFQSGSLNGMDFAVKFNPLEKGEKNEDGTWNVDAQLWEIVANEDYGRKLPDNVVKPKAGDTYVLYGWDSTKIAELGLVSTAEQELKTEAEKHVEKSRMDPSTYGCTMMSDVAYSEDGVHNLYSIGQKVNLINKAYFENGRQSRIIGFEFNLDLPYDSPIYTVGETAAYSRIGELESKIESITLKGQLYNQSSLDSIVKKLSNSVTSQETSGNIQVTTASVGYYKQGDVIMKGTSWENIIRNMLFKEQGAELKSKLSTANDMEFGSNKGKITYEAAKNGNGDITKAFFDNKEENLLVFGAEMNGVRTAVRELSGVYTENESYLASVSFSQNGSLPAVTLTDKISVNVRRKWFAGVVDSIPTTSAQVRGLSSSGMYTGSGSYKFSAGRWKTIVICIPEGTVSELTLTAYPGNFIEDAGVCSGPTPISVEGANGSTAKGYSMWVIRTDGTNDADTFTFKTS